MSVAPTAWTHSSHRTMLFAWRKVHQKLSDATEARAYLHQGLKHSSSLTVGREGNLAPMFFFFPKPLPPKFNSSPLQKIMVGRRSFLFGMVFFRGELLNFQGVASEIQELSGFCLACFQKMLMRWMGWWRLAFLRRFIPWPLTKDWRKNSALPWIYCFPWRSDLSRIFGSIQASMRFTRSLQHRHIKKKRYELLIQ